MVDEILAKVDDSGAIYHHQDALGSTVALTNSAGALIERYTYDVFGAPMIRDAGGSVIAQSAQGNRFLFTGREWIAEVGLYDYRNRAYSPQLGRFFQTDPIRFDSDDVNLYRYVQNNPVDWADPEGLETLKQCLDGCARQLKAAEDRCRKMKGASRGAMLRKALCWAPPTLKTDRAFLNVIVKKKIVKMQNKDTKIASIAERRFEIGNGKRTSKRLIIRILQPKLVADGEWRCFVTVEEAGTSHELGYSGVDSLQALQHAMQSLKPTLETLQLSHDNRLTWLGQNDLIL